MVVAKIAHRPSGGMSRVSWRVASTAAVVAAVAIGAQGVASASVARQVGERGPVAGGHHGRRGVGRDHGGTRFTGTVTALGTDAGGVGSFTISTGRGGLLHLVVDVTATTTFHERGTATPASLANVAVGDRVEVSGSLGATDTIAADVVRIVFDGVVRVTGRVSALDGASGFVLARGSDGKLSVTVDVSAATTYAEPGSVSAPAGSVPVASLPAGTASLASVVVGDRVRVLGTVGGPNVLDATSVTILPVRPVVVVGVVAGLIPTSSTGTSSGATETPGFLLSRGPRGLFELTVDVSATTTYLERGPLPGPAPVGPAPVGSVPVGSVPTGTPSSGATATSPAGTLSLSSVAVGDRVLVRGTVGGPGTLDATSVTILATRGTKRHDG
jgi:hypothetical protein